MQMTTKEENNELKENIKKFEWFTLIFGQFYV